MAKFNLNSIIPRISCARHASHSRRSNLRLISIFIMLAVSFEIPAASKERGGEISDLPPYERAVLLIKFYETMHHPKDWPYIGYGHQVQPGEPYSKGVQLTEAQADRLLRKDLDKLCSMFSKHGKDSLILAALSYNIGCGKVLGNKRLNLPKSSFLAELEKGNRNLRRIYGKYCHYKGKWHKGIHLRRLMEYDLLFDP